MYVKKETEKRREREREREREGSLHVAFSMIYVKLNDYKSLPQYHFHVTVLATIYMYNAMELIKTSVYTVSNLTIHVLF